MESRRKTIIYGLDPAYECIGTKKQQLIRSNFAAVQSGAPEWSRTITPLLAQEPESCVSTNFTTGAVKGVMYTHPPEVSQRLKNKKYSGGKAGGDKDGRVHV